MHLTKRKEKNRLGNVKRDKLKKRFRMIGFSAMRHNAETGKETRTLDKP